MYGSARWLYVCVCIRAGPDVARLEVICIIVGPASTRFQPVWRRRFVLFFIAIFEFQESKGGCRPNPWIRVSLDRQIHTD